MEKNEIIDLLTETARIAIPKDVKAPYCQNCHDMFLGIQRAVKELLKIFMDYEENYVHFDKVKALKADSIDYKKAAELWKKYKDKMDLNGF